MRVLPPVQAERAAGLAGVGGADPEQRAAPRRVPGRHPAQRARAGAAAQAQQDGLGLVVEGVGEQDGPAVARGVERGVPRAAGGGLGAGAVGGDHDDEDPRPHAEPARRGGRIPGHLARARLQAVVHDERRHLGELGGRSRGEGQRVSAPRQRHADLVADPRVRPAERPHGRADPPGGPGPVGAASGSHRFSARRRSGPGRAGRRRGRCRRTAARSSWSARRRW